MWRTLEETSLLSTHKEDKQENIYLDKRPTFSNKKIASEKNNIPKIYVFFIY
jgi:hypothetical protein